MKTLVVLATLTAAVTAMPATASVELATKSKCMTCHDVEKQKMGPAFKEIAAKYKGQKDAEAMLGEGILKGAKGKWGKIPMPAQKIPEADAHALAKWVMTL